MVFQFVSDKMLSLSLLCIIFFLKCCHGFQFPETGQACIIVNMDADIRLTQLGINPVEVYSDLSNATINSGQCATPDESASTLIIGTTWKLPLTMNFLFSKDTNSIVFMDIAVTFNPDQVFNNTDTDTQIQADEGNTRLSKDTASYACARERNLPFSITNSTMFSYEVKITISNVVIQAFNIVNGTLSEAEECTDELTSDQPTASTFSTTQEPSNTTEPNPTASSTEQISTILTGSTSDFTSQRPITPIPNDPPRHTYSVTGVNGTCILIQCGIQFQVFYNTTNNMVMKTIGVPEQFTFEGSCSQINNTQDIEIKFYDNWEVRITFAKYNEPNNKERIYLSKIDLTANLTKEIFPDIDTPVFIDDMVKEFDTDTVTASVSGSYKCDDKTSFALQNGFIMNTFELQYAAFQQNISGFSDSDITQCSSDVTTNSVIPIAVGSALGGLIFIVIVAYLIGRRCQTKSGYDTLH